MWRIGNLFEHMVRISDRGKIDLASKLFPRLFLSVLIITFFALAAVGEKSQEAKAVSVEAGYAEFAPQNDVRHLQKLLGPDSETETATWMLDVLENSGKHPLVGVEFTDGAPLVFRILFDLSAKKMVFRVDRSFIHAAGSSETTPLSKNLARLNFVREATLAMALEGAALDGYLSCAVSREPTSQCFDMLANPHLAAHKAAWVYAKAHGLASVFPRSVALDMTAYAEANQPPDQAEDLALTRYVYEGPLRNIFWADRYEAFFPTFTFMFSPTPPPNLFPPHLPVPELP